MTCMLFFLIYSGGLLWYVERERKAACQETLDEVRRQLRAGKTVEDALELLESELKR